MLFRSSVDALCQAADKNDTNSIKFILEQLVPGYKPKYLDGLGQNESSINKDFSNTSDGKILKKVEPKRA